MTTTDRRMARRLPFVLFAAALALAACEEEGPAEKAGKKLDDAVEEAGDRVDEATDQ